MFDLYAPMCLRLPLGCDDVELLELQSPFCAADLLASEAHLDSRLFPLERDAGHSEALPCACTVRSQQVSFRARCWSFTHMPGQRFVSLRALLLTAHADSCSGWMGCGFSGPGFLDRRILYPAYARLRALHASRFSACVELHACAGDAPKGS